MAAECLGKESCARLQRIYQITREQQENLMNNEKRKQGPAKSDTREITKPMKDDARKKKKHQKKKMTKRRDGETKTGTRNQKGKTRKKERTEGLEKKIEPAKGNNMNNQSRVLSREKSYQVIGDASHVSDTSVIRPTQVGRGNQGILSSLPLFSQTRSSRISLKMVCV